MTDIYIVNQSQNLSQSLSEIIPALQEQVSRDFAPLWGATATLHIADLQYEGQWTILLVDQSDQPNSLGYHIDPNNIPLAKVGIDTCLSYQINPTTAISHELLEMIADPTMQRMSGCYLVEVCDPVTQDYYMIGNVQVSNFCTPRYFGLTQMGHYDQLGILQAGIPELSHGGMVMWTDGQKWNQTFARTQQGQLSWRAHLQGRNAHKAKNQDAD